MVIHWWNKLTSEFIGIMNLIGNSWLKILKITILRKLEISGRPGTLVLVKKICTRCFYCGQCKSWLEGKKMPSIQLQMQNRREEKSYSAACNEWSIFPYVKMITY